MAQPLPREKAADVQAIPDELDHQDAAVPETPAGGTDRRRRRPRRRPQWRERPPTERVMLVRGDDSRTEIAVLEEGTIVEHYVARHDDRSLVGSIYLGRVQNVLPGWRHPSSTSESPAMACSTQTRLASPTIPTKSLGSRPS